MVGLILFSRVRIGLAKVKGKKKILQVLLMAFTGLTVKRTALAIRVYPIIKMYGSSVVLLVYFKQLA